MLVDAISESISTFNLLAAARYLFEALVWVRTINGNADWAAVFIIHAFEEQAQHLDGLRKQAEFEASYFSELDQEDLDQSTKAALAAIAAGADASALQTIEKSVRDEIDKRARRALCLYADSAKCNGYGYESQIISKKIIPRIESERTSLLAERAGIEAKLPERIGNLAREKRSWEQRARNVGMFRQYDFIYRYTSRLLHAMPASIYTGQKNLTVIEVKTLLEYIYISILDAIEITQGSPAATRPERERN